MSASAFACGQINPTDGKQLGDFNSHLASNAYVNGYTPTQEDLTAHKAFSAAPADAKYPHVARWYKHIASFAAGETASWPSQGGSGSTATAAANGEEKKAPAADGKDDNFDLFGSDEEEESEEKKRITEERLKAYAEKKEKKGPGPIAKSSVLLDVKPWDDETDLKEMEQLVRSIETDGLAWGASKLVPVGYGINKLQIICTIEDAKVSVDADLVDRIQDDFSDHVQSVDIAAFNKI